MDHCKEILASQDRSLVKERTIACVMRRVNTLHSLFTNKKGDHFDVFIYVG